MATEVNIESDSWISRIETNNLLSVSYIITTYPGDITSISYIKKLGVTKNILSNCMILSLGYKAPTIPQIRDVKYVYNKPKIRTSDSVLTKPVTRTSTNVLTKPQIRTGTSVLTKPVSRTSTSVLTKPQVHGGTKNE